jgi:hypothetical protein
MNIKPRRSLWFPRTRMGAPLAWAALLLPTAGWAASLRVDTGRPEGQVAVIAGRDGVQQLAVTLTADNGVSRDVTRDVSYSVQPPDRAQVSETGLVTPLAEGEASVTALHPDAGTATVLVRIEQYDEDLPINFPNEVVPLFTKHGCNGGGCHGKSSGQNGFKLSLLGFEPGEDYEFLTK